MFGRLFSKRDFVDEYEKQRLNAKKQEEQAQPMYSRSKWFEQMLTTENSTDEYEQMLDARNEVEQTQTWYSVMIHFTPQAPYVYILENNIFIITDGVVRKNKSFGYKEIIGGSFVYLNELKSMQEVEMFLKKYQLQNPIRIEYLEE